MEAATVWPSRLESTHSYVGEAFSGEWRAFAQCGMALGNLAPCMQDIGINVQQRTIDLDRSWDGTAADRASLYFTELAAATSGCQFPLSKAADAYAECAIGVWLLGRQVGKILQDICDAAIIAVTSLLAGGVLIETGVGPYAGAAVAAMELVTIFKGIAHAMQAVKAATLLVASTTGVLKSLSQGGSLADNPVPDDYYKHPAFR